jgi:hypothetical protein
MGLGRRVQAGGGLMPTATYFTDAEVDEMCAGLQTAADLLETEGYDVASLRASITKATGPTE